MSDDYTTEWDSGKPETPCGKGSRLEETEIIREYIPEVIEEYNIKSVADVGCGDQNWIAHVEWPYEIKYQGYDIKPRHYDIKPLDICNELIPEADLVMTIYVLNHLKPKQMQRALRLLEESDCHYLLTSYCTYDKIPFPCLESIPHKKTTRHEWRYGVFDLRSRGNYEI